MMHMCAVSAVAMSMHSLFMPKVHLQRSTNEVGGYFSWCTIFDNSVNAKWASSEWVGVGGDKQKRGIPEATEWCWCVLYTKWSGMRVRWRNFHQLHFKSTENPFKLEIHFPFVEMLLNGSKPLETQIKSIVLLLSHFENVTGIINITSFIHVINSRVDRNYTSAPVAQVAETFYSLNDLHLVYKSIETMNTFSFGKHPSAAIVHGCAGD